MTVPTELLMPNGHRWSSSAADAYQRCPLAWDLRYGHRGVQLRELGEAAPDGDLDVARRRGRVLHAAVAAALEHADIELRRHGQPIRGTLRRYYSPARKALGRAWIDEKMPSDSEEAARVIDMFERALDAVAIPAPGALHGVEQRHEHITRGGVPVVFIPDVTRWVRRRVLRVTDWKSSVVKEEDVPRHQQLLRYAGWLMEADPDIESCEIELFALRDARGYPVAADPEMVRRAVQRFDRIAIEATAAASARALPGCRRCQACAAVREEAA